MNRNTFADLSRKLWADHPATPSQQKKHSKSTQREILLSLLREARGRGAALELPAILAVGLAQHGARIAELREGGFVIRNEMERSDGIVLSRYWLTFDPEREGQQP